MELKLHIDGLNKISKKVEKLAKFLKKAHKMEMETNKIKLKAKTNRIPS